MDSAADDTMVFSLDSPCRVSLSSMRSVVWLALPGNCTKYLGTAGAARMRTLRWRYFATILTSALIVVAQVTCSGRVRTSQGLSIVG